MAKKVWRLTSLYTNHSSLGTKAEGMTFFSWAHYKVGEMGNLDYTGENLSGAVSDEELRNLLMRNSKLERSKH